MAATQEIIRELALRHASKVSYDAELGSSQADIVEGNAVLAITLAIEEFIKKQAA